MVRVSMRSMLLPGIAVATAVSVALGPVLVAPPAVILAEPEVQIPVVHIDDIALAGIGRDIYNSVSAVAQGLAQWAQWVVGIIPFVGSGIAGQINLIYAGLIQPLIGNTVYALSDIIANPLGLLTTASSYISNQVYVGYTFVANEIRFFGLPPIVGPLPKPPPLASTGRSASRPAASRLAGPRAAALSSAPEHTAPDVAATGPARASRGVASRVGRPVVVDDSSVSTESRAAAAKPPRPAAAKARAQARAVANAADRAARGLV